MVTTRVIEIYGREGWYTLGTGRVEVQVLEGDSCYIAANSVVPLNFEGHKINVKQTKSLRSADNIIWLISEGKTRVAVSSQEVPQLYVPGGDVGG
jgi:hypothetical protein